MKEFNQKLGVWPALLLGVGLLLIGITTLEVIINNWWPIDVARLDLLRGLTLGQADAAMLLDAVNIEILAAFLGAIFITTTGIAMPLAFVINKRVHILANQQLGQSITPGFWVTLRQASSFGIWATFCVWLQMNRTLGLAVALLVAFILVLFELLLQVRTRTAAAST